MKTVLKHFDINQKILRRQNGKGNEPEIRMIMHYLLKKYTLNTLDDIGLICGGYTHDLVLYSIKTINDRLDVDESIRKIIKDIEAKIYFNEITSKKAHNLVKNKIKINKFKRK